MPVWTLGAPGRALTIQKLSVHSITFVNRQIKQAPVDNIRTMYSSVCTLLAVRPGQSPAVALASVSSALDEQHCPGQQSPLSCSSLNFEQVFSLLDGRLHGSRCSMQLPSGGLRNTDKQCLWQPRLTDRIPVFTEQKPLLVITLSPTQQLRNRQSPSSPAAASNSRLLLQGMEPITEVKTS